MAADIMFIVATMPTIEPDVEDRTTGRSGRGGWIVTVFNNDYNTWEEVMGIIQVATGCSAEEAYIETWEIDNLGSSVVHNAGKDECEEAARIIATIGIKVNVSEG